MVIEHGVRIEPLDHSQYVECFFPEYINQDMSPCLPHGIAPGFAAVFLIETGLFPWRIVIEVSRPRNQHRVVFQVEETVCHVELVIAKIRPVDAAFAVSGRFAPRPSSVIPVVLDLTPVFFIPGPERSERAGKIVSGIEEQRRKHAVLTVEIVHAVIWRISPEIIRMQISEMPPWTEYLPFFFFPLPEQFAVQRLDRSDRQPEIEFARSLQGQRRGNQQEPHVR